MADIQPALFGEAPAPPPADATSAPRCRMCARPARWLANRQVYGAYCGGRHCDNHERLCHVCSRPFIVGVDGAGNKYCSTDCKVVGYNPRSPGARVPCAWCDALSPTRPRGGIWPYVCDRCLEPIRHVVDRLKAHHVPLERVRRLLSDPGCEVCGDNLLEKVRRGGHGKYVANLVVDHDHACCPAESHSCGKCVRGLSCWRCNVAAGAVRDDPTIARRLGDYLEAWASSTSDPVAERATETRAGAQP